MEARLRDVASALAARGLDLCAAFPAADYDAEVAPALRLPAIGACAIVVGNTRALWPHFLAARAPGPDPLDAYVERAVREVRFEAAHAIRWAHTMPPTVAIQRAAEVAGLAWLAPSHLSVHPVFGPWIALRAVIVVDWPAPAHVARATAPCDCARGCGPALERALAAGTLTSKADLRDRWRLWLAVRDACPVGRAHRYDDDQIAHHYISALPEGEIPG